MVYFVAYTDHSETEINEEREVFVETAAFRKAVSQLDQHGLLLLQGPPAFGKSTLARALLRHFRAAGFTPLVLHRYEEWRQHVGGDRQQVVLLDGVLGEACLDQDKFADWSRLFPTMLSYPAATARRLVIVVMYTHVRREIEGMGEVGVMGTLFQHSLDLQRAGTYSEDEKRELVRKHTRKFSSVVTDRLIDKILAIDKSGPAFPWGARRFCQLLVDDVIAGDAMSVFATPEVALASFFTRALRSKDNGPVMAALLLLTLKGDCLAPLDQMELGLTAVGLDKGLALPAQSVAGGTRAPSWLGASPLSAADRSKMLPALL